MVAGIAFVARSFAPPSRQLAHNAAAHTVQENKEQPSMIRAFFAAVAIQIVLLFFALALWPA